MKIHFLDGRPLSDAEWFMLLERLARDEETDRLMRRAFRAKALEDAAVTELTKGDA